MSGTTMRQQSKESVSAFLDDELQHREIDRTLEQLATSDELRQAWDRYHLIGDIMRGEGIRDSAAGIADRVREQIEREPAILAAPRPGPRILSGHHWMRPAAGAAIAASVATITILALPRFDGLGPKPANDRVAAVPIDRPVVAAPVQLASAPAPIDDAGPGRGTRWKNLEQPAVESKLNRFLVDHNEYASSGSIGGIMPYATFVSYDSGRP